MSTGVQPPSYEMAYVLFMDIVGYSLRSIDEQTELLTILQKAVRESPEYKQAAATQQLISLPTGDGMALVFLHDPVSPVNCAAEIAAALQSQPEIELRMGVHTGPVRRHADIKEEVNVVGGGVNMAQRVMDFGDAGHILLSRTIAEVLQQLRGWSDCLQDLGIQEVKHGVKVHLYNLCKDGLGNPALPRKVSNQASISAAADPRTNQPTGVTRSVKAYRRQQAALTRRSHPKSLVPFVLKNVMLISVVLLVRASLLISPVGRHVKNAENTILQERLRLQRTVWNHDKDPRLPLVIDISEAIPSVPRQPTNIVALNEVVDALREFSPQAIGIDIDFSPENAPARPMDWYTFRQWQRLTRPEDSRPLPVRLGVFRRRYDLPGNWLGRSEFSSMAAGMAVPDDHQNNYYYVQNKAAKHEPLLQLAASLYEAAGGVRPHAGGILPTIFSDTGANLQYGVYVVDYSYLQELNPNQVVQYRTPQLLEADKDRIKDNVVLIGDVGRGEDKFFLAHTTDLVPGVLIHACSLMTLRNGALRFVDARRSIGLDVVASLFSLLLVFVVTFAINFKYLDLHGVQILRSWSVAFLVLILCYGWVGWAGVFWPDFLWISFALLVAPFLAEPLWRVIKRGFDSIFSFSQWMLKGQYNHAR
jgi:class 3 adenylate cyclase/CHASE2 domain-containing sensor protein